LFDLNNTFKLIITKINPYIFRINGVISIILVLILIPCKPHFFFLLLTDGAHSNKFIQAASAETPVQTKGNADLWDGPILFHQGSEKPVHLILVEKAEQKLHLYRYDGSYQQLKSYNCSTGEKNGKKRLENDEKTPEGIYFIGKEYRDSKITIFGDRAFGLNYPDVFDDLEGNSGSGIFIHGANRGIKPFNTNGCVILSNDDISDLDSRIRIKETPIIIGARLPYGFKPAKNDMSELIPFFKKALVPKRYAASEPDFLFITVIGFQERIVVFSEVLLDDPKNLVGFSRLYLSRPANKFLVLIKRKWEENQGHRY
jgi:hypothetical protein